jgi:hypothetical protein
MSLRKGHRRAVLIAEGEQNLSVIKRHVNIIKNNLQHLKDKKATINTNALSDFVAGDETDFDVMIADAESKINSILNP